MTKDIFIRNDNEVIKCNICIDEVHLNSILYITKYCDGDEKKLVSLGRQLLTENNPIVLSKILRGISEYQPQIGYDRMIKKYITDSVIILEDYDFNSILLSEEEMNKIVFLRKIRNFLTKNKNNTNLDEILYSNEFNRAVIDMLENNCEFDKNNIDTDITDIATTKEIDILRKDTIDNLAYTKR